MRIKDECFSTLKTKTTNTSIKTYSFRRIFIYTFLLLLYMSFNSPVAANELHLVLNGLSHHTEVRPEKKYNEENYGIGLQYDFTSFDKNILPYINAGGFSDSNYNPSFYFGGGISHRTKFRNKWNTFHIDAGLSAFVMTRFYENRYGEKSNSILPGILPMLSFGSENTAVNITYIPETDLTKVSVWFIQLKMKLGRF